MTFFNHNQLTPEQMAELAHRFEAEADVDYPRGLLHKMVECDVYRLAIAGHSEPQYACWFHVQADNMFHANATLSLSPRNKPSDLLIVGEATAKHFGCRGLVFATARNGLVRQAEKQGYRQKATVMERIFP